MSVCTFIASNSPLMEFKPSQNYPLEVNIDKAEIWNKPDKSIPSRPSFYCLKIQK